MHLTQHAFGRQLDALMKTHEVVPLSDAMMIGPPNDITGRARPRAAITFDDAYAGAVTAGLWELRARGLPATIFVTPGFLDGQQFWWDVLADASEGLNADTRRRALVDGRGFNRDVLSAALQIGLPTRQMPACARGAAIADLDSALEYTGITLAAHTWNHPNLTALSDAELADELARPLVWLDRFGDRALKMVSYPYGLADPRVQNAARVAGYSAGFMIDGGWTRTPPHDPFAIPRLNIPAGVSHDGFVLRAAGFLQG
ncbi:MAG: polysaccharide deacetylase family protein [Gemmatimonadaceae bacterium]